MRDRHLQREVDGTAAEFARHLSGGELAAAVDAYAADIDRHAAGTDRGTYRVGVGGWWEFVPFSGAPAVPARVDQDDHLTHTAAPRADR